MEPISYCDLVKRVQAGDPEAKRALSRRFFPRLLALVQAKLCGRILDKDVLVLDSILESVVRHHAQDSIDWGDEESLLWMIGGVALRHCDKHNKRFDRDPERGVGHVPIGVPREGMDGSSNAGFDPADDDPPPEAVTELADFLLNRFTKRQQAIIQMTLEDETKSEMAKKLDCSTKTIDREMASLKSILKKELED